MFAFIGRFGVAWRPVAQKCQFPDFCDSSPGAGFHLSRQPLKVGCSASSASSVGRAGNARLYRGSNAGACGGGLGSRVNVMSRRGLRAHSRATASLILGVAAAIAACTAAAADTLEWALVQAYQNNPSLNAQRAALRATDENVPQALSGYRPKISITSTDGFTYSSTLSHSVNQSV